MAIFGCYVLFFAKNSTFLSLLAIVIIINAVLATSCDFICLSIFDDSAVTGHRERSRLFPR